MDTKKELTGLYVITDPVFQDSENLLQAVESAIKGGAKIVQYRDKSMEHDRRYNEAEALKQLCDKYDVLFIINDDVDLAVAVNADGVHVGKHDEGIQVARRKLALHQIIGVSCYNSLCHAQEAEEAGADYVAFGRFFPSKTKPHAIQAEVDLLYKAKQDLSIPIVAIGGITTDNGASLIDAGADALAVIAAIFSETDIESAANKISALFDKKK